MTSRWQGAPFFRGYGRESAGFETGDFVKEKWGGLSWNDSTLTPTQTLWGVRGLLSRSTGAVLSLRANLKILHVRAIERLVRPLVCASRLLQASYVCLA